VECPNRGMVLWGANALWLPKRQQSLASVNYEWSRGAYNRDIPE
jgi:hypothetical protein